MSSQPFQVFSLSGVRSILESFITPWGQVNLVPMTPPTPTVEAKSSPPSLNLHVVPEVGNRGSHQRLESLSLEADLP